MFRCKAILAKEASPIIAGIMACGVAMVFSSCAYRLHTFPAGGFQSGIASWYGPDFHGKKTSNREIFDMYDMTAAHRTLPFGTYVMVTNLDNGKSTIVRINDRGPFVGNNRIIDLSYAAARLLDMIGTGTAPVRLEILNNISPLQPPAGFSVQVGSFSSRENAEQLKARLQPRFGRVEVSLFETPTRIYYRVRVRASDRDAAMRTAQILSEAGYPVLILEEF